METIFLYELNDIPFEELDKGKIIIGDISPERIKHPELKFCDNLKFKLIIQIKPKKILIDGNVKGVIKLTCDKCLEEFKFYVEDKINYVFFLTKIVVDKKNKEFKLTKEDLEIDFLEEDILPLKNIIFGQFFLNIPIKKLCREDCKGLCPNCGCNLNYKKCNCKKEQTFSPFSKLKELIK